MKLHVFDKQDEIFNYSKVIPFQYCGDVKPFIKPRLLSFTDLDILFQEQSLRGYSLRRYVFFTKRYLTLLIAESKPKLIFQLSTNRPLNLRIREQGKVLLEQGEYGVFHCSTAYSSIVLKPGMQEIIRLEYTNEAIENNPAAFLPVEQWLINFEEDANRAYAKGKIPVELTVLETSIMNTIIDSSGKEEWFEQQMTTLLALVAADQANQVPIPFPLAGNNNK